MNRKTKKNKKQKTKKKKPQKVSPPKATTHLCACALVIGMGLFGLLGNNLGQPLLDEDGGLAPEEGLGGVEDRANTLGSPGSTGSLQSPNFGDAGAGEVSGGEAPTPTNGTCTDAL
jgi:hypothetical protein